MQRTYDLTDRGTAIASITIRELNGADYFAAMERAEGPEGRRVTALDVKREAIADAIVEVDGAAVTTPYPAWLGWGARTGRFVDRAYADLNELTDVEVFQIQAMTGPRFDLSKLDVGFSSVTFREMSTKDELAATAAATSSGLGRGALTAHHLAAAISDLDGGTLAAERFLALPVRQTQLLQILYNRVHSATEAELEDFAKAARAKDTARGEPT